MNSSRVVRAVECGAICVASLLATACRPAPPRPAAPVARPAKLFTVAHSAGPATREFPGVIRAFNEAEISFLVAGRIVKLPVKEGQVLDNHALIAQLDDHDFVTALDAARAQLTLQRTQYISASNLYAQGVISRDEFDQKSRDLAVARANFDHAHKTLEDSILRAPYHGRIARRYAEEGQSIQAKQAIVLLQDISRLKLTVNVPEHIVARDSNMTLEEAVRRANASARLSAYPGRSFNVTLHEFSTAADPDTRTYAATFVLVPPADALIMPGMTAAVTIPLVSRNGDAARVLVPLTAVFSPPGQPASVWLVNTNQMSVTRRSVTTGEIRDRMITIRSGLAPGDTIVAAGVSELSEGQIITRYTAP